MRIFFYKTLFIFLCLLIFYKITIGSLVKDFENKLDEATSKETIALIKEKARDEMRGAIKKDKIFEEKDAILIKEFINKIKKEIN
jgi:hypothetical protein